MVLNFSLDLNSKTQVCALAGSLIGKSGMVSCGFGTSVCANVVGERPFRTVSPFVDTYCCADGKPMLMVCLRNGTFFLSTVVKSYGDLLLDIPNAEIEPFAQIMPKLVEAPPDCSGLDPFAQIMPKLVEAPPDCSGLLALPFMDDEPGLGVLKGGSALVIGWNPQNATVGNVAKAALLSCIFNLRLGCEKLDEEGVPRVEIGLNGGLTKTPACGQILADVFNTPVTIFEESADEGSSWGAAILAKFRHLRLQDGDIEWTSFLDSVDHGKKIRFEPDPGAVEIYNKSYRKYKKLMELQSQLTDVMSM